MKVIATGLSGLWKIETAPRSDERGSFTRIFCEEALSSVRPGLRFVQTNQSFTRHRGTIRGLHYQHPPHAECKLVRCVTGRVFDVAVDLRPDSATYLQWFGVELSATNQTMLLIPEGFAHGFQTLSADATLIYQVTAAYSPESEDGVRWDDPALAIAWPLPARLLSPRDQRFAPLKRTELECV